ncbi:unnamed protein product [Oppiella nova]|uniref:NADH-ubiquinone oxidoreductase chain 4L n=1 Tax=Oppiella nova TaxID=334625 RepID=A0A7R9Q9J1_9ACAR|nr:unnamed protein product [Oppiella nova]CAG2161109.1 unnamed protein product [Oppiella nova]
MAGLLMHPYAQELSGQIFSIIILTIGAAETSIGLAILLVYFRNKGSIIISDINQMRGVIKWLEIKGVTISWGVYVDQLTVIMFIVVTWISTVVHIYSLGYMENDKNLPKFLSFISFFTFFMLVLVSADNFLQLFFGWEGVGLFSYLLIGFWYEKEAANKAAIKAFIVNRVGDFAFMLAIITIFIYCNKADFISVFAQGKELRCMSKSAQIGMHIWLPDAMEGPTPVSALIHAATMVTAGVFLVSKCSYLFEYSPIILQFITIIGGITCLFAATIAITQNDIKKIIAYSTCSQLGYMFIACGLSAYNNAIFHLVTHAFFKALLFLSAGKKMPVTYGNFLFGSLALIGIYPLAGFYSKDLILESAYSADTIDQMVTFIIPLDSLSKTFYFFDQQIIDRYGPNGVTKVINYFAYWTSKIQTGYVFNYTLYVYLWYHFIHGFLMHMYKHQLLVLVFAIIYSSLIAFVQKDIKKMIAYSSIAHMAYVTSGIFSFTEEGIKGAIFQMISHGMLYERLHTKAIDQYGGVAKKMPILATCFMISMLGSIGLPASGIILSTIYMLKLYKEVIK